jgi:hypothetical protein
MGKILNVLFRNRLSFLATLVILFLIPFTVFSTLSARPTSPKAAACYDFSGDGRVNEVDFDLLMDHFGTYQGGPGFDPKYDIALADATPGSDGAVSGGDLSLLSQHIGDTCPPTAGLVTNKTQINKGESATLGWLTNRASSISISHVGTNLPKGGQKVVSPTSTTKYTLTATGPGGTVRKSVTITVVSPSPPPSSTPPSSSSTSSSSTSTYYVPAPKDGTSVTFLRILVNPLSELSGSLNLSISVGKTKFKKNVLLTKSAKEITLKVKEGVVRKNTTYQLVIKADRMLTKKVKFKATSHKVKIKVGDLYLGDLNSDNKVNQQDMTSLLSGFGSSGADANLDGVTNSLDYSIVLKNLGKKGN